MCQLCATSSCDTCEGVPWKCIFVYVYLFIYFCTNVLQKSSSCTFAGCLFLSNVVMHCHVKEALPWKSISVPLNLCQRNKCLFPLFLGMSLCLERMGNKISQNGRYLCSDFQGTFCQNFWLLIKETPQSHSEPTVSLHHSRERKTEIKNIARKKLEEKK